VVAHVGLGVRLAGLRRLAAQGHAALGVSGTAVAPDQHIAQGAFGLEETAVGATLVPDAGLGQFALAEGPFPQALTVVVGGAGPGFAGDTEMLAGPGTVAQHAADAAVELAEQVVGVQVARASQRFQPAQTAFPITAGDGQSGSADVVVERRFLRPGVRSSRQ
jgi:hypothetical protein